MPGLVETSLNTGIMKLTTDGLELTSSVRSSVSTRKEELKDNTVVFAGPSGVGKSSLLNQIDSNFQLKTGDVSDKIKEGNIQLDMPNYLN